jgi:phosphoglycerol transferase
MIGKLASGLFILCASFGALLSWWAFSAPVSFPASAIALSLAVLWFGRSGPRTFWKTGFLSVAVLAMLVFNTALAESYYLTGAGFSETFFYHVRADLLFAGLGEHAPLIALALFLLAAAVMTFVMAVSQPKRSQHLKGSALAVAIALCLWSPLLGIAGYWGDAAAYARADGIPARAYALFGQPAAAAAPLPQDLRRAGAVRLPKRPNLVLLYGESMEQSYFDDPAFSSLTGPLRAIRDHSLHFAGVGAGYAADWTIAGLVATQCGYPLINDPLINLALSGSALAASGPVLPGAVCLGDILAANGYRAVFVGGADTRFAGKRDFLASHGFAEIIGTPEMTEYLRLHPEADPHPAIGPWGYQDVTTLRVAADRFQRLAAAGQSFALVVLTLDTHHPNGLASPDCGRDEGDSMRDAIRCTAGHLAGFVEAIRAGPHSSGTVIGVLSDHLAHRTSQTPRLPRRAERKMTFFMNGLGIVPRKVDTPGAAFDIPATIIDVLGGGGVQIGAGASLLRGPGFLHRNGLDGSQKRYFLGEPVIGRLRELAGTAGDPS